jgi:hypothetical protein
MNTTDFFIDIRNSDEVLSARFDNKMLKFINIPANMIRFNLAYLRDLVESNKYERIFLVCNSGNRSSMVYNKYFANDNLLKSIIVNKRIQFNNFDHSGKINMFPDLNLEFRIIRGPIFNLYNMMRVIQLVLGTVLLLSGIGLYKKTKKQWIVWIMIGFGLMAIFNGLTATCTISKIFMWYLI